MLNTELAECQICGKEFRRQIRSGRRRTVCSEECMKALRRKNSNDYNKRRYEQDPEWRKHKAQLNVKSERRRRLKRYEEATRKLSETLFKANSPEEIAELLNETVRLKGKMYK